MTERGDDVRAEDDDRAGTTTDPGTMTKQRPMPEKEKNNTSTE